MYVIKKRNKVAWELPGTRGGEGNVTFTTEQVKKIESCRDNEDGYARLQTPRMGKTLNIMCVIL